YFSSRRRHTRSKRDWSSDVCSSDLNLGDFFLGFPRAVRVVQIALRHVDSTGDVAGFQVEVFAATGKAVGLAGIDKQAGVVFHVIDRGDHVWSWFYDLVGFDGDIARAGHRRQLQPAPIGHAAIEDVHVFHTRPAQDPAGAAGEKTTAFVVDNHWTVLAQTPGFEVLLESFGIWHGIAAIARTWKSRKGAGGIAILRGRNVQRLELLGAIIFASSP